MSGLRGGELVVTTTYAASGELLSQTTSPKPTTCSECGRVLNTSEDWARCKSDHTLQRLQRTAEGRRTLQMCQDQLEVNIMARRAKGLKMHDANALLARIEELRAEVVRLNVGWREANGLALKNSLECSTLQARVLELEKDNKALGDYNCDLIVKHQVMGMERDAAQAKLRKLEGQEPVDEAMLHTWLELGAPESFRNVTAQDMFIALDYFYPRPVPAAPMVPEGHDSDCAVYNMPAYPPGPCDCSLGTKAWVSVSTGGVSAALLYFGMDEQIRPLGVVGGITTRAMLEAAPTGEQS